MTTATKKRITKEKKITSIKFWVRIIVEKDDPGYHSFTPSLKGLHMPGDTPEEAQENAREAAALMLKVMILDGDPIPIDLLEKSKKEIKKLVRLRRVFLF